MRARARGKRDPRRIADLPLPEQANELLLHAAYAEGLQGDRARAAEYRREGIAVLRRCGLQPWPPNPAITCADVLRKVIREERARRARNARGSRRDAPTDSEIVDLIEQTATSSERRGAVRERALKLHGAAAADRMGLSAVRVPGRTAPTQNESLTELRRRARMLA